MARLRGLIAAMATTPAIAAHRRRMASSDAGAAAQRTTFGHLVGRMSETACGRDAGVETGMSYETFSRRVPVRAYEDFASYVDRARRGESDVLWPGRCDHFALSSGTTSGPTKYIPVTPEMSAHFTRAGLASLLMFAARCGGSRVFAGRQLFLGGSTSLVSLERPVGVPAGFGGDLSGITALKMPRWASALLYEPGMEIAQMSDWPSKLRAIAGRTLRKDITLVAGIPSWLLVLAEELRRRAAAEGRPAATLRDLWPNLCCCIHGGVPIGPFAGELRAALGPGVAFHEVYPASEGFIAAQDATAEEGLRLLADHGIFYEFLPLARFDAGDLAASAAHAVPLEGVKAGVDYVLLMTTPAGLCRYVIGDVVRFTGTRPHRLVYAGRTKLQLSAFGEHVIEKELTDALVAVAAQVGASVSNFHAAPLFVDAEAGRTRGRHEWWIATETAARCSAGEWSQRLDRELARLNEDYAGKRGGGGMDLPEIRLVEPRVFETWMQRAGKWGGQSKMPRCRSDRQVADALAEIASPAPAPSGKA